MMRIAVMRHTRNRFARTALLGLLCWGLLGADTEAQTYLRNRDFINLGNPEAYLNYGRKEYDPYPSAVNARNRYDRLGNYLSRGFDVFNWELSRPGRSVITQRGNEYGGWFGNLVMLSDSYKEWNYRVTMGDDIRVNLSDLTMKDPRWFGILLDGASSDNRFTMFLSQGGDQLGVPKFSTFRPNKERSPVLVFGGHWETKLGNVLRLGTTYFQPPHGQHVRPERVLPQGRYPLQHVAPLFHRGDYRRRFAGRHGNSGPSLRRRHCDSGRVAGAGRAPEQHRRGSGIRIEPEDDRSCKRTGRRAGGGRSGAGGLRISDAHVQSSL